MLLRAKPIKTYHQSCPSVIIKRVPDWEHCRNCLGFVNNGKCKFCSQVIVQEIPKSVREKKIISSLVARIAQDPSRVHDPVSLGTAEGDDFF